MRAWRVRILRVRSELNGLRSTAGGGTASATSRARTAWLPRGYPPDPGGSPVVANQDGALVAVERVADREHVGLLVREQLAVIWR